MNNDTNEFTMSQNHIIERFLNLFCEVEKALKKRLRRPANDRIGFGALVNDYTAKNPYWTEAANQLRNLADIRNLLTHQRGASGYPIAVTEASLKVLAEITEHMLKPEPVSEQYRRTVTTVSVEDSMAFVLALAFDNEFSQFPVISDGRFVGLITENEITRWLGHRAKAHSVEVNIAIVSVRMVLKEKPARVRNPSKEKAPSSKEISIFRFERLDAPLEEVMSRFSTEPALEVILLTANGNSQAPI